MVPCEFRCWGEYRHGSSPLVFVPRWPEVEMSDLTPSLAFFWPTQYRMGRAYSLQKLNGRVVAGGLLWQDSGLCQQGETEGCL